MPNECPSDRILSEYLEDLIPDSHRAEVERHLSRCGSCLELVGQGAVELSESGIGNGSFESRRAAPKMHAARKAAVWAAGLLLLAAGGALWIVPGRHVKRSSPASGRPISALSDAWDLADGRTDAVHLRDGSVLRLSGGTTARFEPPAAGERFRLRLVKGEVALQVAKGNGTVRILGPAAGIQVLGTSLRAKAFRLRSAQVLCVDVTEGAVELRDGKSSAVIRGGQRGIALENDRVYCQDRTHGWDTAWSELSRLVETASGTVRIPSDWEPAARVIAATLWGVEPDPRLEWRDLVKPDLPLEKRAAGYWLVGMAAPPGALQELAEAARRETDPRLQVLIETASAWVLEAGKDIPGGEGSRQ